MSALYDKGRNKFARGEIMWKASGTGASVVRAFLVDASYVPDLANHEFLSDIPASARKGSAGKNTRVDAPQLTLLDPVAGVCDAQDISFSFVPVGPALKFIVLFADGGSDGNSPLIALIDQVTGFPVSPSGGNIVIPWDNGQNKIFKL